MVTHGEKNLALDFQGITSSCVSGPVYYFQGRANKTSQANMFSSLGERNSHRRRCKCLLRRRVCFLDIHCTVWIQEAFQSVQPQEKVPPSAIKHSGNSEPLFG